jgi:hypothetical protein
MSVQQPVLAASRPSANHRVTSPAFAVAEAVQEAAVRGTLAIGLAGIAVIHAVDSVGKWTEAPYIFWMYMGLIVSAIAIGGGVLFGRSRVPVAAAAGLAAAVLAGYVINRTVGMPNATGDIGNWTEPLGLASMVVEGLVLAVAIAGLRTAGALARLSL